MSKDLSFSIKETAKRYIDGRFPNAGIAEKNKVINDWINKIETSKKIAEDFKLRAANPEGLKILDVLWGLAYLPYELAEAMARVFKRSALAENNLHFYTYWQVAGMLKKAEAGVGKFKILEERGVSKSLIKKVIKKAFGIFGLPYKAFLPHIQLVIIKQNR
ncbi:hypothetical protein HY797_00595 [Candidatus Falkowbacteria bacterium]|nr:hypothetical protein [Candidatus Falkowbacteria bacterium]